MLCKLKDVMPSSTGWDIIFNTKGELTELDGLTPEILLDITVKKHREKRSLDANAYCWVLIGKLAGKLNIPKTEIYREAIKEIGDNYEIICIRNKAKEKYKEIWQSRGIGWIVEEMPSKVDNCTNLVTYYGSSTYDSRQMWLLIQNIIEECKAQGIETATPEEVENMMKEWEIK
jgi:hypothetical protein